MGDGEASCCGAGAWDPGVGLRLCRRHDYERGHDSRLHARLSDQALPVSVRGLRTAVDEPMRSVKRRLSGRFFRERVIGLLRRRQWPIAAAVPLDGTIPQENPAAHRPSDRMKRRRAVRWLCGAALASAAALARHAVPGFGDYIAHDGLAMTVLRPASLAWYSARSARCISCSMVSPLR